MTRSPWYTRHADVGDWLIVTICCAGIVAVMVGAWGIGS